MVSILISEGEDLEMCFLNFVNFLKLHLQRIETTGRTDHVPVCDVRVRINSLQVLGICLLLYSEHLVLADQSLASMFFETLAALFICLLYSATFLE